MEVQWGLGALPREELQLPSPSGEEGSSVKVGEERAQN